jgi:hypothetical protein
MASNKEKIKQLRTTADASAKYRDKWLSVDNWIELITNHNSDSALTSQELNRALARDYPTKSLMDTKEGTVNYTGIFRDTKYETKEGNTCRITYYCLTEPGASAASWDSGEARTTQKIATYEDVEEEATEEEAMVEGATEEEAMVEGATVEGATEGAMEEAEEEVTEEAVEGGAMEGAGEEATEEGVGGGATEEGVEREATEEGVEVQLCSGYTEELIMESNHLGDKEMVAEGFKHLCGLGIHNYATDYQPRQCGLLMG